MSTEERVLASLIRSIDGREWDIGQRLPSERALAGLLGTSRSTVRTVLRVLEARGVVEICRGSGCYLRSRRGLGACRHLPAAHEARDGADRLEACYLIFPAIAALAAERMPPASIADLEDSMIGLSRAIFSQNIEAIREETAHFMRLLAEGTGNPAIVATVDSLCPGSPSLFRVFFSLEDFERDMIFADHVKVLHALKRRDPAEARRRMEERILRLCRLLALYEGTECSEYIRKEMEGREVFD
jgi:GntR family transcriptional repressor for pyruvate dehydrogenase complex